MKAYLRRYWWRIAIGVALMVVSAVFARQGNQSAFYVTLIANFVLQIILWPGENWKKTKH
jgi:hypothetical protein